jgi:cytochrome P450
VRDFLRYMLAPAGFLAEIGTGRDVVHFRLGQRRFALLNSPHLIESALTREQGIERDRFVKPVSRRYLGPSLVTRSGTAHAERRALLDPVYAQDQVAAYASRIVAIADQAQQGWSAGQTVNLVEEMSRISRAIVGTTVFGPNSSRHEHALHRAHVLTVRLFHRFLIPRLDFLWDVPLPSTVRFRRAKQRVEALLAEEIAARRHAERREQDVLTHLVRQPRLDDEAVRGEVLTFIFAALDQIAVAVAWTLIELSRHPEAERRVHSELDHVLGARLPTGEDLRGLEYLRQVFAETMRLHPVAWVATREVVDSIALDGARLDPGTTIMISPYVSHRDPRYWERPLEFDPDRWSGRVSEDRPYEASLTFGAGDYQCPGRHLARMACPLVVGTIAARWRLRLEPAVAVKEKAGLTLEPRQPRIVTVEPRGRTG